MSAVYDEAERTKDPSAGSAAVDGQHAAEDGTHVVVAAAVEKHTLGSVAVPVVVRSPVAAAVDTVMFGSMAAEEALQDMLAAVQ
jgi:hypothetical protein